MEQKTEQKIGEKVDLIFELSPEIFLIISLFIVMILCINYYFIKIDVIYGIEDAINNYINSEIFSNSGQDNLVNLMSIITGFIITIVSVFGVGYSSAMLKIVEAKLDRKFSAISKKIMYLSIILLLVIIFAYDIRNIKWMGQFLLIALVYNFLNFAVFGCVAFKMFDYNISQSKKELTKEEERIDEVVYLLRKIAKEDENYIEEYENAKKYNEEMRKQLEEMQNSDG